MKHCCLCGKICHYDTFLLERLNSMTTKRYILAVCILAALLPCCAYLPAFTNEEYARRRHVEMEQQYDPYRLRNTIESYREFIAKFPENMYVSAARAKIDDLEFEPYEKSDTIAAYTKFVEQYPGNRYAVTARNRIDQANVKDSERIDTIQGYRQFLEKHPDNIFALTSQDRLQDLEFRELDKELQQKYGFDLLLYRLHVSRLQKDLPAVAGINLGDFTLFASLESVQGKQYFKSHLIYNADLTAFARATAAQQEQIFDALVAKLIGCLAPQFRSIQGIDGFSFVFAFSAYRFYSNEKIALEYVFPAREALLFAQNKSDRSRLLAQSSVRQTVTAEEKPQTGAGSRALVKLDGADIMEKSAARQLAQDFNVASTWKQVCRDGTVHEMTMVEKWKDFNGAGGVSRKSVERYIHHQKDLYAEAILAVTDTSGRKQYWYMLSKGDPGLTPDIDHYRPPAERDFPLAEFARIPVGKERHQYAGAAACGSSQCYLVHSTPESAAAPYAKKTSYIDQQSQLPVKIEYFDTSGALWKTAHFDWQEIGGVWCWQRIVIENVQTGAVTTIEITDMQLNAGLPDSDFTSGALVRSR